MGQIAERNAKLNAAINNGQVLDVFKDIYHPEVTMEEATGEVWKGLEKNFKREKEFFGSIEELHGGGVSTTAVDEPNNISFATMSFNATMKDGSKMVLTEVAERQWKDGQIIYEKFFYNSDD